jgi:RNA polymerase-binding transcription factor DksA
LRDHLTDEIRRLDAAVAEHEQTPGDLSHVPSHPADRDSEGVETTVAVEHTEWQMLNQVDAALTRIEQGRYGQCQDCGCEIPPERLDAVPYAVCCVRCEKKREGEA